MKFANHIHRYKLLVHALVCTLFIPFSIRAQQPKSILLTGTIIDARSKAPMSGAIIYVSDQAKTKTNEQGEFTLKAIKLKGFITASFVGYQQIIMPYDAEKATVIFIQLMPSAIELDAVTIATGYQILPKERSTGSFTLLNNDQLNQQTGSNILSRLEGISNGVQFDKDGQRPAITVRGLGSINASKSPLIIVDNFPYNGKIENINPNDIESVTILKDASAASIWGAKAGNGVIVITTKKGKLNQSLNISFNANVTIIQKPNIFKARNFMSTTDFITVEKLLFDYGYYTNVLGNTNSYPVVSPVVDLLDKRQTATTAEKVQIDEQINALKQADVRNDIDKYLYQSGLNQQYAVDLQGGTAKVAYTFFIGYDRNIDYLANEYKRLSLHFQNRFVVAKGLNLSTGLLITQSNNKAGKQDYTDPSFKPSLTQSLFPYAELADQDGNPLPVVHTYRQAFVASAGNGKLLDWKYYPLEDYKHTNLTNKTLDLLGNVNLNYQLFPWLALDVKYQYERQQDDRKNQYNEGSFYANDLINKFTQINSSTGIVKYIVPRGSILDKSQSVIQSHNIRGQINLDKSWAQHALSAIVGAEISQAGADGFGYRTYGYNDDLGIINGLVDPVNSYPLFYGGSDILNNSNVFSSTLDRLVSYFGNAAYTFNQKFTLSASARKDQSNLFGVNTNQKGRPFWSAGLAWDISREPFYHFSVLPNLKLRASYGYSGNVDNSLSAFTAIRYDTEVNIWTGFQIATISKFQNPDLRWEKTGILNLGVDFSSNNQRISGSIEYYQKRGTDLLGDALVDLTAGLRVNTIRKNVASMAGHGIDIQLNSKNFDRDFKWYSSLIFNYIKNKVTDYYLSTYQGSNYISQGNLISAIPGYPVYSIFSYRSAGLDPVNGDPRGYLNGEISKDYSAITSTGTKITDLVYSGPATPVFYGALGNTLSWKNLSLSFNISYKLGYYFRKNSVNYADLFAGWAQDADYTNRWQKSGDELFTVVPSLVYPNSANRDGFYNGTEALVRKADHIRLQYINLGYQLNRAQLRKLPVKNLKLNVNASGLGILWRANKDHIDPDYPSSILNTKTITFGLTSIF